MVGDVGRAARLILLASMAVSVRPGGAALVGDLVLIERLPVAVEDHTILIRTLDWLGERDSNPRWRSQSPKTYRFTVSREISKMSKNIDIQSVSRFT